MSIEQLQQKRAELRKYLGVSNGVHLILKYLGNTSYNNQVCKCGSQEADRLLGIIKNLPKMTVTAKTGWKTLSDAEKHFGQPLSEHLKKIDEAGGFKLVRNSQNVVTPIVRAKIVSEILGIKPHFVCTREFSKKYKNDPQKFFQKGEISSIRFRMWNGICVRVVDKKVCISILKNYVRKHSVRSKINNNGKRLNDGFSPKGRANRKREQLCDMLGSKYNHRLILSLFNFKSSDGNKLNTGKEDEIDRITKAIKRLPEEKEIPQGWETLTNVEEHFGEPLTKHVKKLQKNKAFKLIRYFDGVVTPIVNIEKASKILKSRPHFVHPVELHFVHGFPYTTTLISEYLRDENVAERCFKRWDAHNVIVFDADRAIPFLKSLAEMERRPGVFKGGKLHKQKLNKEQIGGWKAKTDDDWQYSWKERARIYRESHPQQD